MNSNIDWYQHESDMIKALRKLKLVDLKIKLTKEDQKLISKKSKTSKKDFVVRYAR